jgi:hypothetical protein
MFKFSRSSAVIAMPHAYPNFLNKGNDPLQMQMPNCFDYPLVFVDVGENLVMVNDVVTPSNSPVAPIEEEELEEAPLDVNVSECSCEEKSSRRVVRTQIDRSAWDHQLSLNLHALAIYL